MADALALVPSEQNRLLEVERVPSDVVTAIWSSAQLGGYTNHEAAVVRRYEVSPSVHLFCGLSTVGDVRVDLDATTPANVRADVLEFLIAQPARSFEAVIADPPYNGKYQAEYAVDGKDFGGNEQNLGRLLKEMYRVCRPGGVLVFKHWFDPKWGGAHLVHQVVTKYGGHRRITLLTVYRKSSWGLSSG